MYSGHPEELALSSAALVGLMRQVFSKGMQFRFQARGASMAPFIQDGDVICIAPLGKNGPGLGEVTAFLHPQNGRLVVHRVVGKHGVTCLIQGDNLPGSPDGLVSIENLLGRVTHVERYGHPVWLGLGPERFAIALFSRFGLLLPVLHTAIPIVHFLFKKADR